MESERKRRIREACREKLRSALNCISEHLETGYAADDDRRFRFRLSPNSIRSHLFRVLVRVKRWTVQGTRYADYQYFGACPYCLNNDGFLNIGPLHWFYCRIHKTKWLSGENLFACWRTDRESDWQDNHQYLSTFQNVAPVYVDPDSRGFAIPGNVVEAAENNQRDVPED